MAMSQSITNQYYQLIEYQGVEVGRLGELDAFLEKALIPSLNRMGIDNVGALSTEAPVDGKTSLFLFKTRSGHLAEARRGTQQLVFFSQALPRMGHLGELGISTGISEPYEDTG